MVNATRGNGGDGQAREAGGAVPDTATSSPSPPVQHMV